MIDGLARNLRVIHDLERAIRVWELVRDSVLQALNEAIARCEKQEGFVETGPDIASACSYVATCNRLILAANARIDELTREDQKYTN